MSPSPSPWDPRTSPPAPYRRADGPSLAVQRAAENGFWALERSVLFGEDREAAFARMFAEEGADVHAEWRTFDYDAARDGELAERTWFGERTDGWSRRGRARLLGMFGRYADALAEIDLAIAEATDPAFAGMLLIDRAEFVRDGEAGRSAIRAITTAIRYARAIGEPVLLARACVAAATLRIWRAGPGRIKHNATAIRLLGRAIRVADRTGAAGVAEAALVQVHALCDKLGDEPKNFLLAQRAAPDSDEVIRALAERVERATQETRLSELRHRRALDGIEQPVFLFIPQYLNGEVVDFVCVVNNRAADILCDSPTRVGAENFDIPPLLELRPLLDRAWAEGSAEDLREVDRAYSRRAVAENGEILLALHDVTPFRQAEASARASERVMREFLANTSHEIRSPLNGILGLTRMLSDKPMDAEAVGYVRSILASGETLLRVLNDVLDLSKLDAGRFDVDPNPVRLSTLLPEVADLFRGLAAMKEISIETRVSPSVPVWVLLDGARLRQVLYNLVGNAVKFSSSGIVEISVATTEDRVRIDVRDSAGGISPEDASRIFRPYAQGAKGRTSGGTGLGLPLSRRLAKAMGGSLEHVPEQGGSVFRIELPLRPAEAPEAAIVGVPLRGIRVLVAEDEPINALVLRSVLERLGARATVVGNGSDAIEEVAAHPYDVIFMDVRMPEMNGLDATRELRQIGVTLPIYALSAGVMEEDRTACREAGMNGFLAKPIRDEEVAAVLMKVGAFPAAGTS